LPPFSGVGTPEARTKFCMVPQLNRLTIKQANDSIVIHIDFQSSRANTCRLREPVGSSSTLTFLALMVVCLLAV
jgi:hypothetical protein